MRTESRRRLKSEFAVLVVEKRMAGVGKREVRVQTSSRGATNDFVTFKP